MSDDEQISSYLRRVRSALRLPREQRRRAVQEIRNHLDDGAAAHMRGGATREQAIGLAISNLGQPDLVVISPYREAEADRPAAVSTPGDTNLNPGHQLRSTAPGRWRTVRCCE